MMAAQVAPSCARCVRFMPFQKITAAPCPVCCLLTKQRSLSACEVSGCSWQVYKGGKDIAHVMYESYCRWTSART